MASPRLLRSCLLATLSATLVAAAAVAPAQAEHRPESAAAVTFSDTFDGPAGSGVDAAKWQLETGDNVNNH
ncbi:glycoside hydrolase family 16 protein, partial [Streptomyces sp. SID5914]|nr:glycoside hydrolase family 16 protein [Streptomyces sp. SID5914]